VSFAGPLKKALAFAESSTDSLGETLPATTLEEATSPFSSVRQEV
jgi:hypothetical protein